MKAPQIARVFNLYPLRFLGVISYSLYLWHSFIIIVNTPIRFNGFGGIQGTMNLPRANGLGTFLLIYVPATVLYSAVSYALIERPARKLGFELPSS